MAELSADPQPGGGGHRRRHEEGLKGLHARQKGRDGGEIPGLQAAVEGQSFRPGVPQEDGAVKICRRRRLPGVMVALAAATLLLTKQGDLFPALRLKILLREDGLHRSPHGGVEMFRLFSMVFAYNKREAFPHHGGMTIDEDRSARRSSPAARRKSSKSRRRTEKMEGMNPQKFMDTTASGSRYVFQDFSSIPAFYPIPSERTRPFGTVHALLSPGPGGSRPGRAGCSGFPGRFPECPPARRTARG